MPSQNLEKLKRESLISEIFNNKTSRTDINKTVNSLLVDLYGKIKVINTETVDFLKIHFNSTVKEEESIFDIIPTESLKEFLNQFNETLGGYATSTNLKSTSTKSNIRFRKILEHEDGASFVKN